MINFPKRVAQFFLSEVELIGNAVAIKYRNNTWEQFEIAEISSIGQRSILGVSFSVTNLASGKSIIIATPAAAFSKLLLDSLKKMCAQHSPELMYSEYPSFSRLQIIKAIILESTPALKSNYARKLLTEAQEFVWLAKIIDAANGDREKHSEIANAFIGNEKQKYKSFFDSVEKSPLTDEQRQACIVSTDRQLLIAAAGSGKTSTLVAKVGYLLEKKMCEPHQILILAFNKAAATEIYDRCKLRLSAYNNIDKIGAKTFHSFGYEIIGRATNHKPNISVFATDVRQKKRLLRALINDAISESNTLAFSYLVLKTIASSSTAYEAIIDVKNEVTKDPYLTKQGEKVKSIEERKIADFLSSHNIQYEYERPYHTDTSDSEHRQYCPDFYFPQIDTWYEHFAIDSKGNAPAEFKGYLEKTEWRRKFHASRKTKFFETSSANFEDNSIYDTILYSLHKFGYDFRAPFKQAVSIGEVAIEDPLTDVLMSYIDNRRISSLSADEIKSRATGALAKLLDILPLAEYLVDKYSQHLKSRGEIDFSDMLHLAIEHLDKANISLGLRYILVDEFQDISSLRANFIKSLLRTNPGSKLFCVGDDWQSINGFSGSEVKLMTEFPSAFGTGEINETQYITTTFRSNQGIANVSSNFILKNPAQIKKTVKSVCATNKGVINLHYYDPTSRHNLSKVFERIATEIRDRITNDPNHKAMFLARYNAYFSHGSSNDFESMYQDALWRIQKSLSDSSISAMTFHKSKGLEANESILLGLVDESVTRRCFPSRMLDNDLALLPLPTRELFEDAEERRLMYVALTRAKDRVSIILPTVGESTFIKEILDNVVEISVYYNGNPAEQCHECNSGYILGSNSHGHFCSNTSCSLSRSNSLACPTCRIGNKILKKGKFGYFYGCSRYPECRYSQTQNCQIPQAANQTNRQNAPLSTAVTKQQQNTLSTIVDVSTSNIKGAKEAQLEPLPSKESINTWEAAFYASMQRNNRQPPNPDGYKYLPTLSHWKNKLDLLFDGSNDDAFLAAHQIIWELQKSIERVPVEVLIKLVHTNRLLRSMSDMRDKPLNSSTIAQSAFNELNRRNYFADDAPQQAPINPWEAAFYASMQRNNRQPPNPDGYKYLPIISHFFDWKNKIALLFDGSNDDAYLAAHQIICELEKSIERVPIEVLVKLVHTNRLLRSMSDWRDKPFDSSNIAQSAFNELNRRNYFADDTPQQAHT